MSTRTAPVTLGNYLVVATLGQGGMGRVHLVQDKSGKQYAAKELLLPSGGWSAEQLKRFEQECDILARLDSPHIVKPFGGIQQCNTTYFYLMEYVPGKNLQQLLKTYGRFSPEIATHYMIQLLTALETAHSQQIIHRDIKPSNLIVNPEGVLKVTDFGIAFDLNATHFTQTGCFLGTPYTISPEQARGEESVPASDLYSLGIVFYELLTGTPPFQAKNALALLYQHQEKSPPPLKEFLPEIPIALDAFLVCCLKKLPEDRFKSAHEAKKDLEQIFCDFSCSPEELIQSTQSLGEKATLVLDPIDVHVLASYSQKQADSSKKWRNVLILFSVLGVLVYAGLTMFPQIWNRQNENKNIQNENKVLNITLRLLLKDQSILEGEWVGLQKQNLLYKKEVHSEPVSVPLEKILEIRDLKNIFSEVTLLFHEKERAQIQVKLVGIDQGTLYGLDLQNHLQVFPLETIREYSYPK